MVSLAKKAKKDADSTAKFTKVQLIMSSRYEFKKDLIDALLDGNRTYTFEEVDKMINDYMRKEVK